MTCLYLCRHKELIKVGVELNYVCQSVAMGGAYYKIYVNNRVLTEGEELKEFHFTPDR